MKRFGRFSLSLTLALCLILAVTSIVSAGFRPPDTVPPVPDPYALPAVENSGMVSSIVSVPSLPGIVVLDSGKYLPQGFKQGDAQFGGSGLEVSGLGKRETAEVCFPFRSYNYQWKGVVSQWNGDKWVALTTFFPTDADGVSSWACANGAGNGTFALITWYFGPPEPPVVIRNV
jgi:hypothetical protein